MGVSAVVENGELVTSTSQSSLNASTKGNDSVNKEDFLQLLVAQMQYQDPLEPTDNTQWVTQYAQFTQVEELQNMSSSMELSRASSLVGQTVIMNVTQSNGSTTTVQGSVEYVTYESGKAYLSINGGLYSLDDLNLVVDEKYLAELKASTDFVDALEALPSLALLTASDKDKVYELSEMYAGLSEKSLSMIGDDYKNTFKQYIERISNLVAEQETAKDNS